MGSNPPTSQAGARYSTDPADFFYMSQNVPCQEACPALTNIPSYIRALYQGDPAGSYAINRAANLFPGVLGRICSRPCEDMCRHGESELGEPVNICHLKRAAADFGGKTPDTLTRLFAPNGKKVAVIGAGPAGLAAANDLFSLGFEVTVYDALERPGGMLRYGIPEFRLPRDVLDAEIEAVISAGVELKCGVKVGQDLPLEQLDREYDAVCVAAGCYEPNMLRVPGENLGGVYTGLDYMMRVNAGLPPETGQKVLVLGAGFTAFDCARSALRLGAAEVGICLRRTENELQVTKDEVTEAKREGIRLSGLMTASAIKGQGRVQKVEFVRTRLGEPDESGRRAVLKIEGSEFEVPADTVIVATGQRSASMGLPGEDAGLKADEGGHWAKATGAVYVCGDYLRGPSTVIQAVASGRRTAERIARDLTGSEHRNDCVRMEDAGITDRVRTWDFIPRTRMPGIEPVEDRFKNAGAEVELGFGHDAAHTESQRCYLCYLHYEIDMTRCIYCRYCLDVAPRDCIKMVNGVKTNELGAIVGYEETTDWSLVNAVIIDNTRCIRCGECMRVCPVKCIDVTRVERVQCLAAGEDA